MSSTHPLPDTTPASPTAAGPPSLPSLPSPAAAADSDSRSQKSTPSFKSARTTTTAATVPTPGAVESASPKGSGSGSSTPGGRRKTGPSGAYLELPRWRFWSVLVSLMISIFLFALDQLIIATAIPKITSEFNALSQLTWLANGFL